MTATDNNKNLRKIAADYIESEINQIDLPPYLSELERLKIKLDILKICRKSVYISQGLEDI